MDKSSVVYSINLSFEEIKLPPFQEILVVGKNCPQGKIGISKSFELLIPNGYIIVDNFENDKIEAVFINKRILKKMPKEKILEILKTKVFPYVSEGELLRVDFKIKISYTEIEITS